MRPRIYPLGDRNIVGARVAELRKAAGWKQVEFMAMLQLEEWKSLQRAFRS